MVGRRIIIKVSRVVCKHVGFNVRSVTQWEHGEANLMQIQALMLIFAANQIIFHRYPRVLL